MIHSNIFQKSTLDSRIGQKKIAKTNLDKMLTPVSRSIPQDRVMDRLEDLLGGETTTDVATLKRENDDLTRELDDLLHEKYHRITQQTNDQAHRKHPQRPRPRHSEKRPHL